MQVVLDMATNEEVREVGLAEVSQFANRGYRTIGVGFAEAETSTREMEEDIKWISDGMYSQRAALRMTDRGLRCILIPSCRTNPLVRSAAP